MNAYLNFNKIYSDHFFFLNTIFVKINLKKVIKWSFLFFFEQLKMKKSYELCGRLAGAILPRL